MAQQNLTPELEPLQTYLHGVAKHLVDQLYGPQGPAWGTKLSELEDVVVSIRQQLSEDMLNQALLRQAEASDQRSQPFRDCPSCGKPIGLTDEPEPRILQTRAGETQWSEPKAHCHNCRRAFFPSVEKSGD